MLQRQNKIMPKKVTHFHLQAARNLGYDTKILQVFFQSRNSNPSLNNAILKLVSKFVDKTYIYQESAVYASSIRYINKYFTTLLSQYPPLKILNFQKLALEQIARVAKILNTNIIKTFEVCSIVQNILFKMYYAINFVNEFQQSRHYTDIHYDTQLLDDSIPILHQKQVDNFFAFFSQQSVDCQALKNFIIRKNVQNKQIIQKNSDKNSNIRCDIKPQSVFKIHRRKISDIKIDINAHQYAKENQCPMFKKKIQILNQKPIDLLSKQSKLKLIDFSQYEQYCPKITLGIIFDMLSNPLINSHDKVSKLDKFINFNRFVRNFNSQKQEIVQQMVKKFSVLMDSETRQIFTDHISKLKNKQIAFKLLQQIQFGQKFINRQSKKQEAAQLDQNLDPSMLVTNYPKILQNRVFDIMEKRNRVISLPENMRKDLRGIINSNLGQKKLHGKPIIYEVQPNKSIYVKNQPGRKRIQTLSIHKILS